MASQKRCSFWINPPLQLQMVATVLLLVVASIFLVTYPSSIRPPRSDAGSPTSPERSASWQSSSSGQVAC